MHTPSPEGDALLQVLRPADPAVARIVIASVRERQAQRLEVDLAAMAEQADGRLALVMDTIEQITSAGINALIIAQNRCRDRGGRLVLAEVNPDIRELLQITGLDRMLLVVAGQDDAIRAFCSHTPKRRRKVA